MTLKESYWRRSNHIVGPAAAKDFDQIGQKETRDAFERFIISHSNPTTRILDAGCNTGVEGFRLMKRGFRGSYFGADSNPKALAHALENLCGYQASFFLADLDAIPFPDRFFQVTINKDVIEHLPSYAGVLKELARVTADRLILSLFIKPHGHADDIRVHPDGYFLNRYNRQKLYSFMSECGLSPKPIYEKDEDEVIVFSRSN